MRSIASNAGVSGCPTGTWPHPKETRFLCSEFWVLMKQIRSLWSRYSENGTRSSWKLLPILRKCIFEKNKAKSTVSILWNISHIKAWRKARNALQSVEAVDTNSTQKQTAEKLPNPDACSGPGFPSHEQCLATTLTGETSIWLPRNNWCRHCWLPWLSFLIKLHTLHGDFDKRTNLAYICMVC